MVIKINFFDQYSQNNKKTSENVMKIFIFNSKCISGCFVDIK